MKVKQINNKKWVFQNTCSFKFESSVSLAGSKGTISADDVPFNSPFPSWIAASIIFPIIRSTAVITAKLLPVILHVRSSLFGKHYKSRFISFQRHKLTSTARAIWAPDCTLSSLIVSPFFPTIKPQIFFGIIIVNEIGTSLELAP